MESILKHALKFFLVVNAVTQAPFFASLVQRFDHKKQQRILRRELFLAFCIGLFFLFIGGPFLDTLAVAPSTVSMCGGMILIFIANDILFPHQSLTRGGDDDREPFLVPIAVPLLSGPTLMTTLMFSTQEEPNLLKLALALFLSFIGTSIVILGAPKVIRFLGKKGLAALEQLLGMLLIMLGVEMVANGLRYYIMELG